MQLSKRGLFNEKGDIETSKRRVINGNTTNLNDFNNLKYSWTSEWYRQAMNNFWIPEEINLSQDVKDYRILDKHEKTAYDKILSFLIYLDSLQTAQIPKLQSYVTANEINLCLSIQGYQESIHSQSYSYILDTICSPEEREEILYQYKDDEVLLKRNKFIGDQYQDFYEDENLDNFMKALIANYILEGIYFYSGFSFFYNLGRMGKMPGTVSEIRYINRDENTHLWLFRNIIKELQLEEPEIFTEELKEELKEMMKIAVEHEISWGHYVIGDSIQGINKNLITDYIKYLGNIRMKAIGLKEIYEDHITNPAAWVDILADANSVKTDFFEAKSTAYAKAGALIDDL